MWRSIGKGETGLRMIDEERQLLDREEIRKGDRYPSRLENPKIEDDPLRRVRCAQGRVISGSQPQSPKRRGNTACFVVELGVRHLTLPGGEGRAFGKEE